jgi:hypothetical protein
MVKRIRTKEEVFSGVKSQIDIGINIVSFGLFAGKKDTRNNKFFF